MSVTRGVSSLAISLLGMKMLIRAIRKTPAWFCLAALSAIGQPVATSQPARVSVPTEPDALRREVMENVLNLPAGPGRVADFNLPMDFVGRVADRILVAAFEEQFRQVVADGTTSQPVKPEVTLRPTSRSTGEAGVRVIQTRMSPQRKALWYSWREDYPGLRGFRVPLVLPDDAVANWRGITRHQLLDWPSTLPPNATSSQLEAASKIASGLAIRSLDPLKLRTHGLAKVSARVMAIPGFFPPLSTEDETLSLLRNVGVPIDILEFFDRPSTDGTSQPVAITQRSDSPGDKPRVATFQLKFAIRAMNPMRWLPSAEGFRMATESGESEIDGLHLQVSRGDDWLAYGDGGCIDIARQLAAALPKARIDASIEQKHLAGFLDEAATWKSRRSGEIRALVSPMPVAQWAQDNCKFGWVESDNPADRVRVALVPRYPSRGEAGAVFIPGEAAVLQGLAESAVARVVQSPLLFQAGNLICVWDAAKKLRVLLIGEADIYRNVALGLSRTQVEEAFRIEFGVDKCVVLPAASFHIDYEVSVRNVNGRTIALVNDEQAGSKLVLHCGIDAMVREGKMTSEMGLRVNDLLKAGDPKAMELLGPRLMWAARAPGEFGQSFAETFGEGLADSGVGNFLCFLRALDLWSMHRHELQPDGVDAATTASFAALRRREADRDALKAVIRSLGWEVVPIPSMGDSKRALNYLNGIHDKTRFFMPAYGGTFEKVDLAAQAAVRKAFGPSVEIVPIRCAESQRREGAVRCSAAVMYAPPSVP